MRIRSKLIIVFLIVVASIGTVGFVSISQLSEVNNSLKKDLPLGIDEIEKTSKLNGLSQFIRYYDEVLTQSARNYAFTQDKKWEDRYKQVEPELDKIIKEAIVEGDDKDKTFFSSVDTANLALVKLEYQSLGLVDQGHPTDAIKILESKEYWDLKGVYEQGLRDYVARHGTAYNDALVANTKNIDAVTIKMENLVSDSTQLLFISIISVLVFAIVLGILFSNNITRSIRKLIIASNEISKGNFDTKIEIKENDEISELHKSFNFMTDSLQKSTNLLLHTQQQYKNLYEDSPILLRTIDLQGKILNCNKSYAKLLGYTKEEVIGKSIFEHVSDNSLEAMKKSFEQWKKTGHVSSEEIWMKRKDGTVFPILLSANNLLDDEGSLIGSNTAIRDITEIHEAKINLEEKETRLRLQYAELTKAHQRLAITEQKYRNLYDRSPNLMRTITTDGIITDCNDAYAKTLGYTKEEAIGMNLFDHTSEKSIDELRDDFETWKKTHQVSHREIWCKRKDGTIFPTLLSGDTLYDEHDNVIGRTVALTDLTEIYEARKKLEESELQIREHLMKLQKLSSLKDDFLTMITHELKTPLVPIRGYSDILMSELIGPVNEEQRKRLEIIRSSTTSLLKLISDLLDAQKIELGQLKLNLDVHDLSEIIKSAVNKMKPAADRNGITITTEMKNPVVILCDNMRIEQVLSNLISNSLDFCPKQEGKININLSSENSNAKIVVKDNGLGIAKESLDKVFVKFYQVDTSMTREHGGTGLGLSVCEGIVEGHGGKIWAESGGRGKGAEIHILLPLIK